MSDCALCGGSDSITHYQTKDYRIIKCNKCGLLFTDPQLTKEKLKKYYTEFADHRYLLKYKHQAIERGKKILEMVGRLKRGGDLLDVGCGYGFFLNLAREKGWRTYGLELSQGALKYARATYKLDLFEGDIAEVRLQPKKFDLITLQHVLEHVPMPILVLNKLAKALKDDGILVVVVPNASSLIAKLAGTRWVCFSEVTHHLFHYTAKTLSLLLGLGGFGTLTSMTCQWEGRDLMWGMKVFLKRFINAEENQGIIKGADQSNWQEEQQMIARGINMWSHLLSWLMAKLGLGEEIVVIARKA